MYRLILLVVGCTLFDSSIAQNTIDVTTPNNITCSDLSPNLSWNATGGIQIQPLRINGSLDYRDDEYFAVINDTSLSTPRDAHPWTVYYRLKQQSTGSDKYRGNIFLDTGVSSNLTLMGSCHQTSSPIDTQGRFLWTKDMLERSLKDTGDCRATLGDECVDALNKWYRQQAAENHMRRGNCEKTNNTLPKACSGFMEPTSRLMNLSRDLSFEFTRQYNINGSTDIRANPSLECNGLNISSTHSISTLAGLPYDQTIRFPTIDIVTFWPNRTDMQRYVTSWVNDVHVEVMCLRPQQIAEGSTVPPAGNDLLNRPGVAFPAANGSSPRSVSLVWGLVIAIGVMVFLQ